MYNQRPCTVDCVLPVCAFVFFYPVLSDLLNAEDVNPAILRMDLMSQNDFLFRYHYIFF